MPRSKALLIALAPAALAACERTAPTSDAPAAAAPPAAVRPPAPATAVAPAPVGKDLPPINGPDPRYVGRWAAAATACGHEAWRFSAQELETPGEVACTFGKVTPTPGGYDIDMTCVAEAPPAPSTLHLRFAESAKAMLVSGGPFSGEVGLVYCGPPEATLNR